MCLHPAGLKGGTTVGVKNWRKSLGSVSTFLRAQKYCFISCTQQILLWEIHSSGYSAVWCCPRLILPVLQETGHCFLCSSVQGLHSGFLCEKFQAWGLGILYISKISSGATNVASLLRTAGIKWNASFITHPCFPCLPPLLPPPAQAPVECEMTILEIWELYILCRYTYTQNPKFLHIIITFEGFRF